MKQTVKLSKSKSCGSQQTHSFKESKLPNVKSVSLMLDLNVDNYYCERCFMCAAYMRVMTLEKRVKTLEGWKKRFINKEVKVHIELSDDDSKMFD